MTLAVYAALGPECVALCRPVTATACAAYVVRGGAVASHMPELLAFGTAQGFLMVFVDSVSMCIYADALLEDIVGGLDVFDLE